ncbi:MAG: hypothetical protein GY879_06070 [Planctomycetes bacterium]|nr:hypothetical protein [Planctomycetota bacterium]
MRTSAERPLVALVAILVLFALLVAASMLFGTGAGPSSNASTEIPEASLADAS